MTCPLTTGAGEKDECASCTLTAREVAACGLMKKLEISAKPLGTRASPRLR